MARFSNVGGYQPIARAAEVKTPARPTHIQSKRAKTMPPVIKPPVYKPTPAPAPKPNITGSVLDLAKSFMDLFSGIPKKTPDIPYVPPEENDVPIPPPVREDIPEDPGGGDIPEPDIPGKGDGPVEEYECLGEDLATQKRNGVKDGEISWDNNVAKNGKCQAILGSVDSSTVKKNDKGQITSFQSVDTTNSEHGTVYTFERITEDMIRKENGRVFVKFSNGKELELTGAPGKTADEIIKDNLDTMGMSAAMQLGPDGETLVDIQTSAQADTYILTEEKRPNGKIGLHLVQDSRHSGSNISSWDNAKVTKNDKAIASNMTQEQRLERVLEGVKRNSGPWCAQIIATGERELALLEAE